MAAAALPRPRASRRLPGSRSVLRCACRLAALALAAAGATASAQGAVNVLCSVPMRWCDAVAHAFQQSTGIQVNLTQKDAGEALAQVGAERARPKHDVWYGGGGDAHLQAAAQGLTAAYRSQAEPELYDWAVAQADRSRGNAVGIYASILGIGYNADMLARKNLPAPRCWSDLMRPEYRDEVEMPNPNTADAAYATIATLIQTFGEDKAFDLLKAIQRSTRDYPRAGSGAIRAAARGETAIAVTYLHDAVTETANGFPIRVVVPCEGTGYEIGSMSIVKGAPDADNARRFYDWALTPAAQRIAGAARFFQMPSNRATPIDSLVPRMSDIKLIRYDFDRYRDAGERQRLLDRWNREVHAPPR